MFTETAFFSFGFLSQRTLSSFGIAQTNLLVNLIEKTWTWSFFCSFLSRYLFFSSFLHFAPILVDDEQFVVDASQTSSELAPAMRVITRKGPVPKLGCLRRVPILYA